MLGVLPFYGDFPIEQKQEVFVMKCKYFILTKLE